MNPIEKLILDELSKIGINAIQHVLKEYDAWKLLALAAGICYLYQNLPKDKICRPMRCNKEK